MSPAPRPTAILEKLEEARDTVADAVVDTFYDILEGPAGDATKKLFEAAPTGKLAGQVAKNVVRIATAVVMLKTGKTLHFGVVDNTLKPGRRKYIIIALPPAVVMTALGGFELVRRVVMDRDSHGPLFLS